MDKAASRIRLLGYSVIVILFYLGYKVFKHASCFRLALFTNHVFSHFFKTFYFK